MSNPELVSVGQQIEAVAIETGKAQSRLQATQEALREATLQHSELQLHIQQIMAGMEDARVEGVQRAHEASIQQALLQRGVLSRKDASLRTLLERLCETSNPVPRRSPSAPRPRSSITRPTASAAIRVHVTKQLKGGVSTTVNRVETRDVVEIPPTTRSRSAGPPNPVRDLLTSCQPPYTTAMLDGLLGALPSLLFDAEKQLEEATHTADAASSSRDKAQLALDTIVDEVIALNRDCAEEREKHAKHLERANRSKHLCRRLDAQADELSHLISERQEQLRAAKVDTAQFTDKLSRYTNINGALLEEDTITHKEVASLQQEVRRLEGEIRRHREECEEMLNQLLQTASTSSLFRPKQQPDNDVTKAMLDEVLVNLAETSKLVAKTKTDRQPTPHVEN